jgi:hypothetical protein
MTNPYTRSLQALALVFAASAAMAAHAKKYAPPAGTPTATVRVEVTNTAKDTSGRNYFSLAAFAPERCHERNRKQASMAYLNMRHRSANAGEEFEVEAGKPIALSFFYLHLADWGMGYATSRLCVVDGAATFAAGDRVVARFEVEAEVTQCRVTFTSEAATPPAAPSTFAMYPMLCWPDEGEREQRSGVGFTETLVVDFTN